MPLLDTKIPGRHPHVPTRRLAFGSEDQDLQIKKDLYVVDRGQRYPVPVDKPGRKAGLFGARSMVYKGRDMWVCDAKHGTHRKGVKFTPTYFGFQRRALDALKKIDSRIPYYYYLAVLGHDIHVSARANLYGVHWHSGWADPITQELRGPLDETFDTLYKTHAVAHECDLLFCPGKIHVGVLQNLGGFVENLGLLSAGKVTDAFISETIDELVSTTGTEYADFDFHEVGTSNQAEDNNDTALITTSGIARVTGTPTDVDPIYRNVGTITADATETWEEHGLFNNVTGAALMDRSLTSGQSVNSSDQVQYTYELTENPEA